MRKTLLACAFLVTGTALVSQAHPAVATQLCSVPGIYTYYSTSAHTTIVGTCGYKNCATYLSGDWECTGTTSAYSTFHPQSCSCYIP